jgi:hypothetical protein
MERRKFRAGRWGQENDGREDKKKMKKRNIEKGNVR